MSRITITVMDRVAVIQMADTVMDRAAVIQMADTAMDKMTVTLIAVLIMVESLVMDIVSLIMGSRRNRLVERHIIFSILVTLCCCLPLGIVSIVYASKINSLQNAGDYEGAKAAAKKAKIFMIIGAVGGLIASVGLFATGYISDSTTVQTVENMLDEDADTTDSRDDVTETDDKESTKEPVTANEDLGDSWKSYTVQINDAVVTFPCEVSKLEETGLTLDTDDKSEDYVINKDDYELVYFQDSNANSLMFIVSNKTDSAKTIKECKVSGIYVDEYDVEDGSLTVIFPGNIQVGMDISDVEAKWGEASDVYEGEYSHTYSWYDEDTYNYCTVSVDPETKKVTMIDLDGQDLQ